MRFSSGRPHALAATLLLSGALVVGTAATAVPTSASTLFSDGFESGYGAWTRTVADGGGAYTSSSSRYAGSYGLRLSATSSTGSLSHLRRTLATSVADLSVSAMIRVTAEGQSGSNVPVFVLRRSDGSQVLRVYRQNATGGQLWVSFGGRYVKTSASLALGAWNRVAVRTIVGSGATDAVTVTVNGTTVLSLAGADLGDSWLRGIQLGQEVGGQAYGEDVDDVTVSTPTGATATATPTPSATATPIVAPSPTPTPTVAPTATPSPTPAAGIYVSTSGSDSASGTSSAPLRTIQRAVDIAPAGTTIWIRGGTYAGATISRSGLTISNVPGEIVVVAGDSSRTRVVHVRNTSNIRISGITIQKAPAQWGAGLYVEGSDRVTLERSTLRWNKSFGAKVSGSTNVVLSRLDVYGNDTGIEGSGYIAGFQLVDSKIHDHSTMVTDSDGGARGANATNFYQTTGAGLIARNEIWNNRAKSVIYGADGGAFEIYGAKDLTYDSNRVWDNQNVVEMGTSGPANERIVFTNNVAWKPSTSTAAVPGAAGGIMIRACQTCTISNNRLYRLDSWSFLVVTQNFTSGVVNSGVSFRSNQVEQSNGKAVSITDWTGISVGGNTYYLVGGSVGFSTSEPVVYGSNPVRY